VSGAERASPRLTWVQPEDLLAHELATSRDEGRDVEAVAQRWAAAGGSLQAPVGGASATPATPALRTLALQLLDELDALGDPQVDQGISRTTRRAGCGKSLDQPGGWSLDRVRGGWLGRGVGCLLGKPVEKIPREGIREILHATDAWPLDDYFTAKGLPAEVARRWPWNRRSAPTSLRENIAGMPEDDDLNFALLALRLLETSGPEFTSADVAHQWLAWLPAGRVFTAERVAYRNLLLGLEPPETARRHNPFREWIGALIRTDVYGWVNPGQPDRAAEMAWRDARVSHVRAGVHGAMWAAALASAAVVADDIETVLDAAESVVPADSRFASAVRFGREVARVGSQPASGEAGGQEGWENSVDQLYARYGHLHWVHVLNNAALAAAALTHGQGDFTRTICAAVSAGWDTDSVGATVGAVTGALGGAAALPDRWTRPLHNRLHTSLAGLDGISFDDLAERTWRVAGGVSS
jgi:ADP-ribosylglycohydrolase